MDLSTLIAQITATGVTAPTFATILSGLTTLVQNIYGSDIYIAPDSQDAQFLGVLASLVNNCNNAVIAAYNNCSPATAQGAGLSSVVKINGLQRLVATNSTADVNIVGQAGTTIVNGVIQDTNGNSWNLPASVVIPVGGLVTVTATAQSIGSIAAAANTLTTIQTPTLGWQTVTNPLAAVIGNPVESDAALRARQTVSTSIAAKSILGSMVGAIANIPGVTQYKAYENSTKVTDSNGIPGNSISLVVQGGDSTAIATAINNRKSPGAGTYGTTAVTVADSVGIQSIIRFFRPTTVPVDVNITIKAYNGYVSSTGTQIVNQLKAYLNSLPIGGVDNFVFNSKLYLPADNTGTLAPTYNVTVLTARRDANAFSTTDVPIAFNELPIAGNVTLTVV